MKKLLLILLLGFAVPSYATTYYVSTTGSNSNNCAASATITTPKLTIQNFLTNCTLNPGDTLYIRGGVYVERATLTGIAGSPGNYITISEYPNEEVIIRPATGVGPALSLYHAEWVHIYGIHTDCIHNTNSGCLDINTGTTIYDGTWLDHVRVSNNGREGLQANCPNPAAFEFTDSEGWYESGTHFGSGGSNNKITNSEFDENGAHGIYTAGSGMTIENNNVHDNCYYGMQKYPFGDNYTVRNNRFYNNVDSGLGLFAGTGSRAYNNISYNNGCGHNGYDGSGITMRYGEINDEVYFNTLYGNCFRGIDDGGDTAGAPKPPTQSIFKNNIAYANGEDIHTNNAAGPPSTFSNNMTTDPHFLNAATGEFHLADDSAALGAGVAIGGITTDYDGETRPNPPAIGALEVPSGSNPTDPLAEDFNAYTATSSIDTLNGGSGWTTNWELVQGTITVETAPAWMTTKSLRQNSTTVSEARRFFTAHSGAFSIFFNVSLSATPNDYVVVSAIAPSGGALCRLAFTPSGDLTIETATLDAGITVDHSYAVEMNFDTINQVDKCRAKIDGGSYSSWQDTALALTSVAGVLISSYATNAHTFWLDDISDETGTGGVGTIVNVTPNAGQICVSGSTCAISWAANGITGAVNVYYLVGGNQYLIASPDVAATPYTWTVNAPAGTAIKTRVSQGVVTNDSPSFTVLGTKAAFK